MGKAVKHCLCVKGLDAGITVAEGDEVKLFHVTRTSAGTTAHGHLNSPPKHKKRDEVCKMDSLRFKRERKNTTSVKYFWKNFRKGSFQGFKKITVE